MVGAGAGTDSSGVGRRFGGPIVQAGAMGRQPDEGATSFILRDGKRDGREAN